MKEGKKSVLVGITCILIYIVNYYLRHVLSVMTPTLVATGDYTVEVIANLSSTYMLLYAFGQLINGFLGDIFSPKHLICIGLFVSGSSMALFPWVNKGLMQTLCFALLGFALSMLRGPLMKIISENTKTDHARLICVFFSFAGFAGPLIASLFALIQKWNLVFVFAGVVSVVLGVVTYFFLSVMESRGLIQYRKTKLEGISSILGVFRLENIFFYLTVAGLSEIGIASIGQWITIFLTEPLEFSKDTANLLYSAISIVRSLMPFVCLAIFRAMGERDVLMLRATFFVAAVTFALLLVAPNRWLALAFLLIALMAMSCISALLWSIYIPGLGKTGRVSSANGVIDCFGYVAAAGANLLFANAMSQAGWNTVYILWATIGIIGFLSTFVLVKKKKSESDEESCKIH